MGAVQAPEVIAWILFGVERIKLQGIVSCIELLVLNPVGFPSPAEIGVGVAETIALKSALEGAVWQKITAAAVGKFKLFDCLEINPCTEFIGTFGSYSLPYVKENDRRFS